MLSLSQYLGFGISNCWRGLTLYDAANPASKELVSKWVNFFVRFQRILTSDGLVHVRSVDGQSVDCVLHVDPRGAAGAAGAAGVAGVAGAEGVEGGASGNGGGVRGLALLINPTDQAIVDETIVLPLYYTGLRGGGMAVITQEPGVAAVGGGASRSNGDNRNGGRSHILDQRARASLRFSLPPFGITWFTVEEAPSDTEKM